MLVLLAAVSSMFFKAGALFSTLHYHMAWIFFDPHVIMKHFEYAEMFKFSRPFLGWNPLG